jgi:hypothetical protein
VTAKPLTSRILRAAAATLAAYAVVLQMFLAGLLAAQTAAAHPLDWSVICSGSTAKSGGSQTPSSGAHADCVLACAQGFAGAAALPANISIDDRTSYSAASFPADASEFDIAQPHSPKSSQGPPQIA